MDPRGLARSVNLDDPFDTLQIDRDDGAIATHLDSPDHGTAVAYGTTATRASDHQLSNTTTSPPYAAARPNQVRTADSIANSANDSVILALTDQEHSDLTE